MNKLISYGLPPRHCTCSKSLPSDRPITFAVYGHNSLLRAQFYLSQCFFSISINCFLPFIIIFTVMPTSVPYSITLSTLSDPKQIHSDLIRTSAAILLISKKIFSYPSIASFQPIGQRNVGNHFLNSNTKS